MVAVDHVQAVVAAAAVVVAALEPAAASTVFLVPSRLVHDVALAAPVAGRASFVVAAAWAAVAWAAVA